MKNYVGFYRNNIALRQGPAHAWGLILAGLLLPRLWHSYSIFAAAFIILLSACFNRNSHRPGLAHTWRTNFFMKNSWPALLPALLYLLVIISFLRTTDIPGSAYDLERRFSLLAIPIMWFIRPLASASEVRILFRWFSLSLLISSVLMLSDAVFDFAATREWDAFVYHRLCHPIPVSAVYFAWFLVCWHFWPDRYRNHGMGWSALKLLFAVMLFLSASKLFVVVFLAVEGWRYGKNLQITKIRSWIIAVVVLLMLVPVGLRYNQLRNLNLQLVGQNEFRYDSPFNGLNLRLIQWRFAVEILNEQQAWLYGVTNIWKQDILNAKYEEYGMYTGNPELGDVGYRQYNFHNQYVESSVASGLSATLILLLLFLLTIRIHPTDFFGSFASLVCVAFLFMLTESVLERMQGMILFCTLVCLRFSSIAEENNG